MWLLASALPYGSVAFWQHAKQAAAAQRLQQEADREMPSIFVAVLSRRGEKDMRSSVRKMWNDASKDAKVLWVNAKFVVCTDDDALNSTLAEESQQYDDLIVAECEEGYLDGKLSQKVLTAMEIYHNDYDDYTYFMKTDIDSFVNWRKLGPDLVERAGPLSYMGVPLPLGGPHVPCRNESSRWYESYDKYPDDNWKAAMAGGTGYVVGHDLVKKVIVTGIGEQNILNNEDRGTGLWMYKLREEQHIVVGYQNLSGVDWLDFQWGWSAEQVANYKWGEHEYMMQHGLPGDTIKCLYDAATEDDPELPIASCYPAKEPSMREGCWADKKNGWFERGEEAAEEAEKNQALVHVSTDDLAAEIQALEQVMDDDAAAA